MLMRGLSSQMHEASMLEPSLSAIPRSSLKAIAFDTASGLFSTILMLLADQSIC